MGSLHNDLDTWASRSRISGSDRIEIDNKTAHAIAHDLRKLATLEDAFKIALIGGNHLSDQLISSLGAGFPSEFPPDMPPSEVLGRLGPKCIAGYNMWCAWAALMRARDTLEEFEGDAA